MNNILLINSKTKVLTPKWIKTKIVFIKLKPINRSGNQLLITLLRGLEAIRVVWKTVDHTQWWSTLIGPLLFPSSFPVPERPGLSTKFDYSINASFGLSWFPFLKVHSHLFEWDELHLESRFFYPTALSPSTRVRGERKSKHGRAAYAWLTDEHSPKLNMQPFFLLLSHTELLIFNILCKTNEEVRCFFKMPSDFKNYDGSLVDCVFKSSHDNWVFKCRYVLCNKN